MKKKEPILLKTWIEWGEEPGLQLEWTIGEHGGVHLMVKDVNDGPLAAISLNGHRAGRMAKAILAENKGR